MTLTTSLNTAFKALCKNSKNKLEIWPVLWFNIYIVSDHDWDKEWRLEG